jgi:hypothetical protein
MALAVGLDDDMSLCRSAEALHRAAELLGGRDRLAIFLAVPLHRLQNWLSGREDPPYDVLAAAVDVLID